MLKPKGLAESMNKFFIQKIENLKGKIPLANCDPLMYLKEAMANRSCTFKLNTVSILEIKKIVRGLKNSSATGGSLY